jgi:hypothetical protein
MLEQLKTLISQRFSLTQPVWVFLTVFDRTWLVIWSEGTILTDKPLGSSIEMLYKHLVKDTNWWWLTIIDVVINYQLITDMQQLSQLDIKNYWVAMVEKAGIVGAMLPDVIWVDTCAYAYALMREKYKFTSDVQVYVFNTQRIALQIK